MKVKLYLNNDNLIAGVTLKDDTEPESNNMALHSCVHPENILKSRKKLADSLLCSLSDFVCCKQTHSANFYHAKNTDKGRGSVNMDTAIPETDALYTYEPNLLLCCFTADCVPVIFYHETAGLVGVIHSGWQGTVKEITPKVLHHLKQVEHCNPEELKVYIGPALSQEKFEVDYPVYAKFKELNYADDQIYYNQLTRKYHIDNQQIVKMQCLQNGIQADRIMVDQTCTYQSSEGFSYRQDKQSGRHLSFIMKKSR